MSAPTVWEEGRMTGSRVTRLAVVAALVLLVLDLAINRQLTFVFDIGFVLICVCAALAVHPRDFFHVGVLPPLLLLGLISLVALLHSAWVAQAGDGFVQLGQLVHLSNAAFRAIKAATPGPYTFILPATGDVPKRLMHPKKRTVGVRIPDHAVVQALLEELGEPLLSSTLLMPGATAPMTDGWQVKEELDHWVDAVIDSGECDSEPTTVVDFSDGLPVVARVGAGDPSRFE